MAPFEFNEDCLVSVETIGREHHSIVIIDDFLKNPLMLVDTVAESGEFAPVPEAGNFYPGVRASAPRAYAACVYRSVSTLFEEVFGVSNRARARVSLCAFSLATLKPHQLNPIQSLPHFDTSNPNQYALLHYLFNADLGGTSFYRHRETGFEAITNDRCDVYVKSLESSVGDRGIRSTGYVNGDTNLFERIAEIPAKFNRLIIYRSFLLHSGSIREDQIFSADPRAGRLTANMFIEVG